MELPSAVVETADRLGLVLREDVSAIAVERHQWTVRVDASHLMDVESSPADVYRAAWILFGIRLGIDGRAGLSTDEKPPASPMRFRRTSLRRYHEAPSVHGDRLPVLAPPVSRRVFEAITGASAFCRTWLLSDVEVLVIREVGKRLEVLTEATQRQSGDSAEQRWDKVRSALFYQSYKVRPREVIDVDGGTLRIFETEEGFGASRALLLPEFDYNAAREYGFLAVPTRDRIIIARPDDKNRATAMLPELMDAVDTSLAESPFGLTDAIFQLEPEHVTLRREAGVHFSGRHRRQAEVVDAVIPP